MLRDCFLNVDWLTVDECQFTLCEGGTDLPGERAEHSGHYHKIGDSVVDTAGEVGAAICGGPVSVLDFFAGSTQIYRSTDDRLQTPALHQRQDRRKAVSQKNRFQTAFADLRATAACRDCV